MPHFNIYVSDTSYARLLELAKQQGYISPRVRNAYGLSSFLADLSFRDFTDNRPDWLIRQHEEAISRGRHPDWVFGGERRISRYMTFDEQHLINYFTKAMDIGVFIVRRLVNGGQLRKSLLSVSGNMIEAIGLELIIPDQLPICTPNNRPNNIRAVSRTPTSKLTNDVSEDNPYFIYLRRGKKNESDIRRVQ